MAQKLITFAVPCYNSAAYMRHCIEGLTLVAHNKAFDESCLKAVFSTIWTTLSSALRDFINAIPLASS